MTTDKFLLDTFKELQKKFNKMYDFEATDTSFRGNSINERGEQLYLVCQLEAQSIETIVEIRDPVQGYCLLEDYTAFYLNDDHSWACKDSPVVDQGNASSLFDRKDGIVNLPEHIFSTFCRK